MLSNEARRAIAIRNSIKARQAAKNETVDAASTKSVKTGSIKVAKGISFASDAGVTEALGVVQVVSDARADARDARFQRLVAASKARAAAKVAEGAEAIAA